MIGILFFEVVVAMGSPICQEFEEYAIAIFVM